jgi:hypothetical protein
MEKDKKFCVLSVEICDVLDDLFVDFDSVKVNVSLKKLVVVVGQRWSVVHWTEADGGDPTASNVPRIRSSGEDIDVCLETTLEISKFRGANSGFIDSQFIDSGFE